MIVHFGLTDVQWEWPGSVVCIGTFDGVHCGHQAVIQRGLEVARAAESPLVVVTFDRHPAVTLAPERAPAALATLDENLSRLQGLGVDVTVVLPFDQSLSETGAADFLECILRQHLKAEQLVIGHDFALGKGREGTAEWLQERIKTHVVEPWLHHGERASSTQIRAWVQSGAVDLAAEALGRPYRLSGVVVKGQQLGRTLGYPTANLALSGRVIVPTQGIYATRVKLGDGQVFGGATSIGTRPTVGGTLRTIETFIVDFTDQNLYGTSLSVDFLSRVRDEAKFESLESLVKQMDQDLITIRARLAEHDT